MAGFSLLRTLPSVWPEFQLLLSARFKSSKPFGAFLLRVLKAGTPPGSLFAVVSSECPADCFECRSIIPAQTEPFFFDLTERAAFLPRMVDSGWLRQCFSPTCGL